MSLLIKYPILVYCCLLQIGSTSRAINTQGRPLKRKNKQANGTIDPTTIRPSKKTKLNLDRETRSKGKNNIKNSKRTLEGIQTQPTPEGRTTPPPQAAPKFQDNSYPRTQMAPMYSSVSSFQTSTHHSNLGKYLLL